LGHFGGGVGVGSGFPPHNLIELIAIASTILSWATLLVSHLL